MSSNRDKHIDFMASETASFLADIIGGHMRRLTQCCPNCVHFAPEPVMQCTLNGQKPPSTIIAFGCECFKNNDCPF